MDIAVTGHRPNKLGGYGPSPTQDYIRAWLRFQLASIRPSRLITGMALGLDTWAAETCLELGVPFVAAVPFVGQESRWQPHQQEHYRALLAQAAQVVVVSPGEYSAQKMQIRNEWMVDHCVVLLAVWDGSPGGTANTASYAERVMRPTVRLASWP